MSHQLYSSPQPSLQPPQQKIPLSLKLFQQPSPSLPLQLLSINQQPQPYPQLQTYCHRCGLFQASTWCKECKVDVCQECNGVLHGRGKFATHCRGEMVEGKGQEAMKEEVADGGDSVQEQLVRLTANQRWDALAKEISLQFQYLLQQINQRRTDILAKLTQRKHQEISSILSTLQESRHNPQTRRHSISDQHLPSHFGLNLNKTRNIDQQYPSSPTNRLKYIAECEHQDEMGRCMGRLQTNFVSFEQLKAMVERIDLKVIVCRVICRQEEENKKKMRSSMLNMKSVNSTLSPNSLAGFKSPRGSKLSQSFYFEQKIRNISDKLDKLNEEQGETSVENKLQKVKSERFLGLRLKGNGEGSNTGNKIKKLGIMI